MFNQVDEKFKDVADNILQYKLVSGLIIGICLAVLLMAPPVVSTRAVSMFNASWVRFIACFCLIYILTQNLSVSLVASLTVVLLVLGLNHQMKQKENMAIQMNLRGSPLKVVENTPQQITGHNLIMSTTENQMVNDNIEEDVICDDESCLTNFKDNSTHQTVDSLSFRRQNSEEIDAYDGSDDGFELLESQ